MKIDVSRKAIDEAAEKVSNWGRWGPDDPGERNPVFC